MPLEAVYSAACDSGFSRIARLDVARIKPRQEVREACAADKCRAYGKNWSCPPACGSLEEWEARIRQYQTGLILQTTGSLEDSFDFESMSRTGDEHNAHLRALLEKLESRGSHPWLLMGSGACKNCVQCTCPQSPCPFPQKMIVSVEAMGIVVSELCGANSIPYYYGPNTITFVGCVLINVL